MRSLIVAGIVIVVIGVLMLIPGGSFITRRNVLKVGEIRVTADEQRSIPPWAGGVVMLVGVALIVTGARRVMKERPAGS